jgi:ubiquinol-cytochrome c reductase iron-sulfur subunit
MDADLRKRRVLTFAVGALAGVSATAVSIPFIKSLYPPSHKGPPYLDIDISKLRDGQMFSVSWKNKPLYILKRSQFVLDALQNSNSELLDEDSVVSIQPIEAQNPLRSIRPDIFVAWGVCTHLGCSVSHNPPGQNADIGEPFARGVWFCPCHGSVYDLAGRVYKNAPAQRNLDIPKYEFIDDNTIRVGWWQDNI